MAVTQASEPEAWVDERQLGAFLKRRYGGGAATFSILVIKELVRSNLGDVPGDKRDILVRLYRRARYREDGAEIGPDLRVPLDTALLVLDLFEAAHTACLRVLARRRAGMLPAPSEARLLTVMELLLSAGCEPPAEE